MDAIEHATDHAKMILAWLKGFGLRFNPFEFLESSADPALLRYTVIYEGLAQVWERGSALIFAPVGGGKTALRLYATWSSLRNQYAFFAIPYVLPEHWDALPSPEFDKHGHALMHASADAVLTVLAAFPQRYLRLHTAAQHTLARLLWQMHPELDWVLAQWEESDWEEILGGLLPPALAHGFLAPPVSRLRSLITHLRLEETVNQASDPFDAIHALFDFLQMQFGYRSVHFLVDGVDAFFETNRDPLPIMGQRWLGRWLEGFQSKFEPSIFIKVFVPDLLRPHFRPRNNGHRISQNWPEARLQWSKGMLVEMLRRRLFVASDGKFDSLDALADIKLYDLDRRIVDLALPATPREVLWLANRLFIEHCRHQPIGEYLEEQDVRRVIEAYRVKA